MPEAEGGEFAHVARECEVVLADLSELDPQVCMYACMYVCMYMYMYKTHARAHARRHIYTYPYISERFRRAVPYTGTQNPKP